LLVKWSRLVGALGCDPLEWIACPEMVEQAPRDVLPDEERRLRDVAESFEKDGTLIGFRDSLIFHLMLDAGLRVSEVIEMKLSDLDFDNEKIHVLGKGKKHRWVYMRKTLNQRIRNWLDRKPVSINDTLITSESGSAIRREEAYRRFVRLADSANVKATPHYMRHQFVMNYMAAYMRGDPSHFAAALTAASQETGDLEAVLLKYYTGPRESDMRAAMDAM
jgi:site-specific recombinase XerC